MAHVFKNGFINGFLHPLLKGFGQVLLQENLLSGSLVIAGIFVGSEIEGLTALLAGTVGLGFARVCEFPEKSIEAGSYVFNAVLLGIAIVHFFPVTILAELGVVIGAAAVTMLTHLLVRAGMQAFTFPFILLSWLTIYGVGLPPARPRLSPEEVSLIAMVLKGFGQLIFQSNQLSGVLFLTAILVNSGLSALYALAAGLLGSGLACLFGAQPYNIHLGTFGYNSILCSLVFAGKRSGNLLKTFYACLLATQLMIVFVNLGIIPLTFPFVGSVWIVLGISELDRRIKRQTEYL